MLIRLGNLELPGDLDPVALVGGDSNDCAVRPWLESRQGNDPDESGVLDVGELRVDRGDVRAEHAVGEDALRISID